MTLDELEELCGPDAKRLCQTCEPKATPEPLPPHVFIMFDEDLGLSRYMTYTEDGRVVPFDNW